jgi:hypothetical protein
VEAEVVELAADGARFGQFTIAAGIPGELLRVLNSTPLENIRNTALSENGQDGRDEAVLVRIDCSLLLARAHAYPEAASSHLVLA